MSQLPGLRRTERESVTAITILSNRKEAIAQEIVMGARTGSQRSDPTFPRAHALRAVCAGRSVRNICLPHVFSYWNPHSALGSRNPTRATSLCNATHSGGVLVGQSLAGTPLGTFAFSRYFPEPIASKGR